MRLLQLMCPKEPMRPMLLGFVTMKDQAMLRVVWLNCELCLDSL
jgi:hypothetical protein